MCNLKEKTDLKTVTIYKAVEKIGGKYYAFFAGTLIKLGTVEPQSYKNVHKRFKHRVDDWYISFNDNMVGKCSGFKMKSDAIRLADGKNDAVLKIKLGGEIWIGDALNIDMYIPDDHIIYAGSEILSFEEI